MVKSMSLNIVTEIRSPRIQPSFRGQVEELLIDKRFWKMSSSCSVALL